MTKIVGIVLVRNEDRFIGQAVENVVDFCDEIIILDNNSTDATFSILEKLQTAHSEKIKLHRISDALLSHDFIASYAGTPTWIFAVDGDEVYDPKRLASFRLKILSGIYDTHWNVFGNCIHVTNIKEGKVHGYMAPPSRSITKLYNFNAITQWQEYTERLHGDKMLFKEGYSTSSTLHLYDKYSWEQTPFRCLHLCFVPRSSLDKSIPSARFNPLENSKGYFPIVNFIRNLLGGKFSFQSAYKLKKYRRGPIVEIDTTDFF